MEKLQNAAATVIVLAMAAGLLWTVGGLLFNVIVFGHGVHE